MKQILLVICFLLINIHLSSTIAKGIEKDPKFASKIYNYVDPAVLSAINRLANQQGDKNGDPTAYNLPEPKKIYEDESGSYYGIFISINGAYPSRVPPRDVHLYVAAIRKPDSQGRIFDAIPKMVKDRRGNLVKGYAYGKSETERVNKDILPRVKQLYDKKWYKYHLWLVYYIEGHHFGYPKGPFNTEEWLFSTAYSFDSTGVLIPSYEKRGLEGVTANHMVPTVEIAMNTRRPMPKNEKGAVHKIQAMFSYHKQNFSNRKQKQLQKLRAQMDSDNNQGTVYLSSSFWNKYKTLETARNIFDGNFHFVDNISDFASTYLSYVDTYYSVCEKFLPPPDKRASFTSHYFNEQYGITIENEYYVEMEPRFADKYENFRAISERADFSAGLDSLYNSLTKGGGPFAFNKDMLSLVAEKVVSDVEMRLLLNNCKCNSAIVKQLGDNLFAAASGQLPIQISGKSYKNANRESQPITLADAKRYQNLSMRYRARNPLDKSKVLPYVDEELVAYMTGVYAKDQRTLYGKKDQKYAQRHQLRKIGSEIAADKHPVLRCYYGPVGIYPGGDYKYRLYLFWYVEPPKQLENFLNARIEEKDVDPGLLRVVSSCPCNSDIAHKILIGEY